MEMTGARDCLDASVASCLFVVGALSCATIESSAEIVVAHASSDYRGRAGLGRTSSAGMNHSDGAGHAKCG